MKGRLNLSIGMSLDGSMEGLRDEKPDEYPEPRLSGIRRSEPLREGGCLVEVISSVEESLRDMVVVWEKEGLGRKGVNQQDE